MRGFVSWWRTVTGLERGILIAIAGIVVMLVAMMFIPVDPCAMHRPCLTWIYANNMMQCTQHGPLEMVDPAACEAN